MTSLIVAATLVLAILLVTLIVVPVMQQRRLLRTRSRFGGRLLVAQDGERAAIARKLHDHVVPELLALVTDLRGLRFEPVMGAVDQLDRLTKGLREVAHEIHPSVVDHVGLNDTLRDLVETFEERSNIRVEWYDELESENLSHAERLALYRVAQEALGNVAKHAGVDHVRMGLRGVGGKVELLISDEGKGFRRSEVGSSRGIGLTSMEERLALLGGSLRIDASPGRGTRVTARLPAKGAGQ